MLSDDRENLQERTSLLPFSQGSHSKKWQKLLTFSVLTLLQLLQNGSEPAVSVKTAVSLHI